MSILLKADKLTKRFKVRGNIFRPRYQTALDNFSFTIYDDRPVITAIAGESGSGKTTLARLLLGFITPTSGHVRYQGKNLDSLNPSELKQYRTDVQAVFQDPFEVYNPFYKVDHILKTPVAKFELASSNTEADGLIRATLEKVGLRPDETLGRFPHQISGGQRQRIMIARALLLNPRIIIADEPVSMVDASMRSTILDRLLALHKENGITLLYVTHDLTTAYQLCDYIVILYKGIIVEVGDVESVIKHSAHPYTQLLIKSIPQPNPARAWGSAEDKFVTEEDGNFAMQGCRFVPRCPHAMPVCRKEKPPLFAISANSAATCFLYKTQPECADMSVFLEKKTDAAT